MIVTDDYYIRVSIVNLTSGDRESFSALTTFCYLLIISPMSLSIGIMQLSHVLHAEL